MKVSFYDYCTEHHMDALLQQWHPVKNKPVQPQDVSYGSHKKIWWRCEKGHEWQTMSHSRIAGNGCPYCAGRKLRIGENDLATTHPELISQWHPIKNKDITPADVSAGSNRKVWWICEKGHEWQAIIKSRADGTGCPYCANRKLIVGENDLASTHPALARQWNPTRNGSLTPQSLVAGSKKKVWWQCEKGHEWCATVVSRAYTGAGCPVCAGKVAVPGENDLASEFPEIAAEWHPTKNEALTPDQMLPYSGRKVWWQCKRGHAYEAAISSRTMRESGCPYCAGRKVMVGFNDLATAKPTVAAQWHPTLNGTLTPQMITAGSHKKIWWKCTEGHIWNAVVYSRTSKRNCGCPVCAGKVKGKRKRRYMDMMRDVAV